MRKVIFSINSTLDGCVSHMKGMPDEESMEHYTKLMRGVETLVYGRKIYQLMVPFWPEMAQRGEAPTPWTGEFAKAFAAVPEFVVFSRTLKEPGYPKARIVSSDPADEVRRMKAEKGGDIHISGVDIPSQLMKAGLVDELRLLVAPMIAGVGPRLMEGMGEAEQAPLKLAGTKAFQSGCVELRYLK